MRSLASAPGRHRTASEFIAAELRHEILTGAVLKANDPLPLDELAQRFGTSVIPIREALRVLESERLVVLTPHRTARVATLSLVELKDLYRIRLLLDVEAVRMAHGNLSAEQLERIRADIDAMEAHASQGDYLAAFSIHADVHFAIYRAAGSPTLVSILERLWDETERYRHAVKHYRGDVQSWAEEHRFLVELLERGTAQAAADEMRAQLTRTLAALVRARSLATPSEHDAASDAPSATAGSSGTVSGYHDGADGGGSGRPPRVASARDGRNGANGDVRLGAGGNRSAPRARDGAGRPGRVRRG
jgi:DNA-binding GntR family transcriptional regulator